uniref:Uncharacterized protein n=1 Tax=Zea mays TaxID=4577 RepID=A0A804QJ55_MAIZE
MSLRPLPQTETSTLKGPWRMRSWTSRSWCLVVAMDLLGDGAAKDEVMDLKVMMPISWERRLGLLGKLVLVTGGTNGIGLLVVASLLSRNIKSRLLLSDLEKASSLFGKQDESVVILPSSWLILLVLLFAISPGLTAIVDDSVFYLINCLPGGYYFFRYVSFWCVSKFYFCTWNHQQRGEEDDVGNAGDEHVSQ